MNMKFKAMLLGLSIMTALPVCAQKPVYLDTNKPIEERVKDALNRMTLEEKVAQMQDLTFNQFTADGKLDTLKWILFCRA